MGSRKIKRCEIFIMIWKEEYKIGVALIETLTFYMDRGRRKIKSSPCFFLQNDHMVIDKRKNMAYNDHAVINMTLWSQA